MPKIRDKHWTPPTDMPPAQTEACLAGRMCGVKLRQPSADGHRYCRQAPAPGQTGGFPHRCKYHGGCAAPPLGNTNALKHGIYTGSLLKEEQRLFEQTPVGDLTNEIRIVKLRLRRALLAEAQQAERLRSADASERENALEVESASKTVTKDARGQSVQAQVARRVIDYSVIVHRIVLQIVKLENARLLLHGDGGDMGPEDRARLAQEYLRRMRAELDVEEN